MTEHGRGTYLRVYDHDEARVDVDPSEEPRIDAAVTAWLDTRRDSLLRLTCMDGAELTILASAVQSWLLSTPESRRRSIEQEAAGLAEVRESRIALGLWNNE